MTVRKSFAKILRKRRLECSLSQEELAAKANLSMRSISLFETGKQQPTLETLDALAVALGISMTELVAAVDKDRHYMEIDLERKKRLRGRPFRPS